MNRSIIVGVVWGGLLLPASVAVAQTTGWEMASGIDARTGKTRLFATATVRLPQVGVYRLALQCADGEPSVTTIEAFTGLGKSRPIAWPEKTAKKMATARQRIDGDNEEGDALTPTRLPHVGELGLRRLPQTRLRIVNLFPDETVEFSFSRLSNALAEPQRTKPQTQRDLIQEMCFSVPRLEAAGAPTASATPVRIEGALAPPTTLKRVPPVYPTAARVARIEGTVIMDVTIDPTGHVRKLVVLQSTPLLDEAAIDAVEQWEYTPTLLNGVAVSVVTTVTINFSL